MVRTYLFEFNLEFKKRLFSKLIFVFVIIFFLVFELNAQIIVNVKYLGLSGHLKKSPHPQLYKRKLDKNGFVLLNIGTILGAEYVVYKDWLSIKAAQGFISDCGGQFAGFSHIGIRFTFKRQKHFFSIGNGPTFFFRKDWKNLPGYVDAGLFNRNDKYQYIFFWYAGEVEYNFQYSDKIDVGVTFIPGPPEFFSLAPGIRIKM